MSYPPVPASNKIPQPIGTPSVGEIPQVSQVSPLELEWTSAGAGTVTSVTATDTSIVVSGTDTVAPTIATGTLDVIATEHPPAANWSNNSKKITSLLNGASAQDAAAFGQIPVADTTASDIQPAGVAAAGSNGKWADSGHVHPNYADLSQYLAPSGATGETFPRTYANTDSMAVVSGTVYASAIALPSGLLVSNITLSTGGVAFTGVDVTHGWYALLDSGLVIRAITADQTGGTKWVTTFTFYPLPVASAYTTTYGGLFYIAFCATFTGPALVLPTAGSAGGLTANTAPVLCGTSSSTESTPPSTGTTLGAITGAAADRFYAYTS